MGDSTDKSHARKSTAAFTVAASPFNAVKLELVIVLIVGFVLWLVMHSITDNDLTHILILFLYSASGALWLSVRVRNVSQQSSDAESAKE